MTSPVLRSYQQFTESQTGAWTRSILKWISLLSMGFFTLLFVAPIAMQIPGLMGRENEKASQSLGVFSAGASIAAMRQLYVTAEGLLIILNDPQARPSYKVSAALSLMMLSLFMASYLISSIQFEEGGADLKGLQYPGSVIMAIGDAADPLLFFILARKAISSFFTNLRNRSRNTPEEAVPLIEESVDKVSPLPKIVTVPLITIGGVCFATLFASLLDECCRTLPKNLGDPSGYALTAFSIPGFAFQVSLGAVSLHTLIQKIPELKQVSLYQCVVMILSLPFTYGGASMEFKLGTEMGRDIFSLQMLFANANQLAKMIIIAPYVYQGLDIGLQSSRDFLSQTAAQIKSIDFSTLPPLPCFARKEQALTVN